MLQPRIASPLRRVLLNSPQICQRCQRQAFRRSTLLHQAPRAFTTTRILRHPTQETPSDPGPEPEFVPKPLGRPIGFPHPPRAGQNVRNEKKKVYTGKTMSERNLQKRADLVEEWKQNPFRDLKNIRKYRSGKTFIANPKVFKKEAALYFPNFHGRTIAGEKEADTTNVLMGKLSVVKVYSSQWGYAQTLTFTGPKENGELKEVLEKNKDVVQAVDINIEENPLKGIVLALSEWNIRRKIAKEDRGRYFIVNNGVSDRMRETIGLLNGRVGYVYLLDEECKIRWAGSGDAEGSEKEDMNKGLALLIRDIRNPQPRRAPK